MTTHYVSWTEISTARECPHKHALRYKERWRWPGVAKPLAIGILWHEILEAHYRPMIGGRPPGIEDARDVLVAAGAANPQADGYDIAQTCLWMYDGYRRLYGEDRDWEILEVEREFEVPLGEAEGMTFVLRGKIDLVVRMNGKHLWVVDHKANRNIPRYDKDLDLDDQMPLYIWAMRQLGWDIRGAQFNIARTQQTKKPQTPQDRFGRIWAYRSDHELEVVVQEALQTIAARYRPGATDERHPDPQNCKWRCPFVEPCIGGRKAKHLEEQLLISKGFEVKQRERYH